MASTILSQTIGGITDQSIVMEGSQWGRQHGYGDNWNTLRFGFLFNSEPSSSLASVTFRFGLCHGTTNMPGDATCDNFYGLVLNPQWNSSATGYGPVGNPKAYTIVGTTVTTSSLNGGSSTIFKVNTKRSGYFLDVVKGSPNYTCKVWSNTNTTAADLDPATFLFYLTQTTPGAFSGVYAYVSPTGTSLAVDAATNGALDSIYMSWSQLIPRIFVSNIGVVRLA